MNSQGNVWFFPPHTTHRKASSSCQPSPGTGEEGLTSVRRSQHSAQFSHRAAVTNHTNSVHLNKTLTCSQTEVWSPGADRPRALEGSRAPLPPVWGRWPWGLQLHRSISASIAAQHSSPLRDQSPGPSSLVQYDFTLTAYIRKELTSK